jgi:hypothetical protein
MGELADYGIDIDTLQAMHHEWLGGAKKSDLERRYLNKPESHGKLFSSLVREHLGIETERQSHLTRERNELAAEVRRLQQLLQLHGIDPRSTAIPQPEGPAGCEE